MRKKLMVLIVFIFALPYLYRYINFKYAKELKSPIFKGIMGEIIIKLGDEKYVSVIENELSKGEIKK